jgi:hypothetical protein
MARITPKTNWVANNIPVAPDFNRIENNNGQAFADIDQEVSDRQAAITSEKNARQAAINAEENARISADNNIVQSTLSNTISAGNFVLSSFDGTVQFSTTPLVTSRYKIAYKGAARFRFSLQQTAAGNNTFNCSLYKNNVLISSVIPVLLAGTTRSTNILFGNYNISIGDVFDVRVSAPADLGTVFVSSFTIVSCNEHGQEIS